MVIDVIGHRRLQPSTVIDRIDTNLASHDASITEGRPLSQTLHEPEMQRSDGC